MLFAKFYSLPVPPVLLLIAIAAVLIVAVNMKRKK
jgi:hypothetical protein